MSLVHQVTKSLFHWFQHYCWLTDWRTNTQHLELQVCFADKYLISTDITDCRFKVLVPAAPGRILWRICAWWWWGRARGSCSRGRTPSTQRWSAWPGSGCRCTEMFSSMLKATETMTCVLRLEHEPLLNLLIFLKQKRDQKVLTCSVGILNYVEFIIFLSVKVRESWEEESSFRKQFWQFNRIMYQNLPKTIYQAQCSK